MRGTDPIIIPPPVARAWHSGQQRHNHGRCRRPRQHQQCGLAGLTARLIYVADGKLGDRDAAGEVVRRCGCRPAVPARWRLPRSRPECVITSTTGRADCRLPGRPGHPRAGAKDRMADTSNNGVPDAIRSKTRSTTRRYRFATRNTASKAKRALTYHSGVYDSNGHMTIELRRHPRRDWRGRRRLKLPRA